MRARRRVAALVGAFVLVVGVAACSSGGSDATSRSTTTTADPDGGAPTTTGPLGSGPPPIVDSLRIEVLSSQPDRVSGDDARVRVTPGPGDSVGQVHLRLGDRDVTGQLHEVDGALEGVVTGFIEGTNVLTASAGADRAIQRVRAWPLTGPIFSGPPLPLYGCTTEVLGLGPATDDDCSAARRVTWRYVTTKGTIADLPSGGATPADIATTGSGDAEIPRYVRVERGTVDRAVYELATLAPSPDDAHLGRGWNGELLARLGGDCGTTFDQGTGLVPLDPALLGRGYAIVTTTLTDASTTCNDVLAAEALSMAKERAIELLGMPRFTIGLGERGGATLAHLVVQNYPGLLNGVVAIDPLPDVLSTLGGVADCAALERYYATPTGSKLTTAQRAAIDGQRGVDACRRWTKDAYGLVVPTDGCGDAIPTDRRYDAVARPDGVRCDVFDALETELGSDRAHHAWRTLDNEGLQYGFDALNDGLISFQEFIDLNRAIGGWDDDGGFVRRRAVAALDGVSRAYETGRISMGGGDQLAIPIVDVDRYDDATGALSDLRRAFSLRDRLARGRPGDVAPGFQIWVRDATDARTATVHLEAVDALEEWLDALADDTEGGSMTQVLRRTRPTSALDQCLLRGDATPRRGLDVFDPDDGRCTDDLPIGGDPRTAAGGPRSGHVLKCSLKAPDPFDYAVDLTSEQVEELVRTFPTGVCDWFVPSAGQTIPAAPDRSYEDVTSPAQSA